MKPAKTQTQIQNKMEMLDGILKRTTASILEAGKLMVEMINEDPENYNRIKARYGFSDYVMERFQNIGLGRINPELALKNSPAAAMIERLPRAEQDRIIERGVEVVQSVVDGKPEVQVIPYNELTHRDAAFALGGGKVKSVEEQAKKLEEKIIVISQKEQAPYEIIGDDVIWFHDAKFKLLDLEALVERLKRDQFIKLEARMKQRQVASA